MKKLFFPIVGIVLIAASAFTVIVSQDWKIADNYTVKFSGGDPSGEFKGLKGVVNFDPADPAAGKFDVTVDVATINTGNGMKNTHAKSAMWFDAEKYPTIRFTSSSIGKSSNGQYEAKGTLEMHGVKKEITVPFTFNDNTFAGTFEVNRMDYGINTAEPDHGAQKFKVDLNVPVSK
jgi:polyisoprenoid-binding protein YceI